MKAVRPPLEYGDNFPVPKGSYWDPTVPWRFPQHRVRVGPSLVLRRVLPWMMLGVGLAAGILWRSWRTESLGVPTHLNDHPSVGNSERAQPVQVPSSSPQKEGPRKKPLEPKSRLA